MRQRLARLIVANGSPRGVGIVILMMLAFYLPSLAIGFFADDYLFLVRMRDATVQWRSWELYSFVREPSSAPRELMDLGYLPWFSHEELKLNFFRPLSSLAMTADNALLGDAAWAWHLHSLAWLAALIAVAAFAFKGILPRRLWLLATVIFAVSDKLALPTVWIANRNSLLAATFGLAAFGVHVTAREAGRNAIARLGLAVLLVIAALGSAEAGLGFLAYIVAFEMIAAPGSVGRRIAHLAPYGLVLLGYLALYKAGGYGAAYSGGYVDPTADPLVLASTALTRLGALVGGLLGPVPSEMSIVPGLPIAVPAMIGFAFAAAFLAFYVRAEKSFAERDALRLRALLVGSGLAILPSIATIPMNRVLIGALFGAAAAMAACIQKEFLSPKPWRRRYATFLVLLALLAHPLWGLVGMGSTWNQARLTRNAARTLEVPAGTKTVILLTAPDHLIPMYAGMVRRVEALPHPPWLTLSMAMRDHRLTRVDAQTFDLEPIGGRFHASAFEALFRAPDTALRLGETVQRQQFTAEITAAEDGFPTKIRFRFPTELPGAGRAFYVWKDQRLQRVELPGVGKSMVIVRETGPVGL